MKKLTGMLAVMTAVVGTSVIAKDADIASIKDLKTWTGAKLIDDGKVLEATNSKFVNSKIFPIDSKKSYVLSGYFKSGNDKKNASYLGIQYFDKNKKIIDGTSVTTIKNSGTELAEDVKKGDKVIKLKNASKSMLAALKVKRLKLGFNSDNGLPNRQLSAAVTKLEKVGDVWVANLSKAVNSALPKGTKVIGHSICGHYSYVWTSRKNIKEWAKFSGVISPEVKVGSPGRAFWPGTKYGRVIVLANWGQRTGEVLQMKDFSLTKKTK